MELMQKQRSEMELNNKIRRLESEIEEVNEVLLMHIVTNVNNMQ